MLAMDMDFDCATSLVSNGLCSTVTVLRDVASGNSTDRHAYRRLELKRTAQTLYYNYETSFYNLFTFMVY
eukprot:m.231958 g.231958  ORF g.231958 m.231958 type:complete len:70 (-) comp16014_c0_seq5:2435-2644(-)